MTPCPYEWLGAFTPFLVLLGVHGMHASGLCSYFEVSNDGTLFKISIESHLLQSCQWLSVGVTAKVGKTMLINPDLAIIDDYAQLWAFGSKPLNALQWDPLEFVWKDLLLEITTNPCTFQFFQYAVWLGYHILQAMKNVKPATKANWDLYGISDDFLFCNLAKNMEC